MYKKFISQEKHSECKHYPSRCLCFIIYSKGQYVKKSDKVEYTSFRIEGVFFELNYIV